MKVERVYTRSVVGVPRSCRLKDAAALMHKAHVGTLLVREGDEAAVEGFITDRDIVVQAVAQDLSPRETTVGEVMTPMVATVPATAELLEAIEMMRNAGIRRLVVTNGENQISGIVSMDDVIDGVAAELSNLAGVLRSERARETAQVKRMHAS